MEKYSTDCKARRKSNQDPGRATVGCFTAFGRHRCPNLFGLYWFAKVLELAKDQPLQGLINIDTLSAKNAGDKKTRAPKISTKRAAELYD
ncbi:MAG: hypothetical protein EBS30_18200 [Planctomycetes bacterium]|nr:hypothetical protein [Planctomycetota bacterium]